jgi:hypothetical protein
MRVHVICSNLFFCWRGCRTLDKSFRSIEHLHRKEHSRGLQRGGRACSELEGEGEVHTTRDDMAQARYPHSNNPYSPPFAHHGHIAHHITPGGVRLPLSLQLQLWCQLHERRAQVLPVTVTVLKLILDVHTRIFNVYELAETGNN